MTDPGLRTLAGRIADSDDVFLHTGRELLAASDLPVEELAEAVWGDPERFTLDRVESQPGRVWADWLAFWENAVVEPASVSPRPVHERVVELVESGHVGTVLTENVFGLLRQAGVPTDRCIEFHGRVDRARCRRCDRTYDLEPARTAGNRRCRACGRTLGPGIVLATEPPAKADRLRAWARAEACDLYVAAGTPLTVHPTVENAEHAVETGADLAVVSEDPTALDGTADYRLSTDPASALSKLRDALAILS